MIKKLISVLAIVLPSFYASSSVAEPAYQTVTTEQLQNQTGWVILDVRTVEEYQQGHVPGARNVPHQQILQNPSLIAELKDKPVVVYCRSGRRAQLVLEQMQQQGFSHAMHLEGDMQGWYAREFPIE